MPPPMTDPNIDPITGKPKDPLARYRQLARVASRGPQYAIGAAIGKLGERLYKAGQHKPPKLSDGPAKNTQEAPKGSGPTAVPAAAPNSYRQPDMYVQEFMGEGSYVAPQQRQQPTNRGQLPPSVAPPPATTPPGVRRPPTDRGLEYTTPPMPPFQSGYGQTPDITSGVKSYDGIVETPDLPSIRVGFGDRRPAGGSDTPSFRMPTFRSGFGETPTAPEIPPATIPEVPPAPAPTIPTPTSTESTATTVDSNVTYPTDDWWRRKWEQEGLMNPGNSGHIGFEAGEREGIPTVTSTLGGTEKLPPGFDPNAPNGGGGSDAYDPNNYRTWKEGTYGYDPETDEYYEFGVGGVVDEPTKAIIGEDEPEYIVPASKADEFAAITAATGEPPNPADIPANARGMMDRPPATMPPPGPGKWESVDMGRPPALKPPGAGMRPPAPVAPAAGPLPEPPVRQKPSALRRIAAGALGAAANARGGIAGMASGAAAGASGVPGRGIAGAAQEAILYPGYGQKMEQYQLGQQRAEQQQKQAKGAADIRHLDAQAAQAQATADAMNAEGRRAPSKNIVAFGTDGLFDATTGKVVREPSAKAAADYIEINAEDGKALGLKPDAQGNYRIPKEGIGPYLSGRSKPERVKPVDQQVLDAAIRSVAAKRKIQLDDTKDLMGQLPVDAQAEAAQEHKRLNTLPPSELDNLLKRSLLEQRKSGRSNEEFSQTQALGREFRNEPTVKGYSDIKADYDNIVSAARSGKSVDDLTIIRAFAHLTDPRTGVREEEARMFAGAGGLIAKVEVLLPKLLRGEQLTPELRQQFVDAARRLYENRSRQYQSTRKVFTNRAKKFSLDPTLVFDDDVAVGDTPVTPPATKRKPLSEIF